MPLNTLAMLRGMTNAKQFTMIEFALRDFKGVSEAVQMMQTKEIPELFRRAQK